MEKGKIIQEAIQKYTRAFMDSGRSLHEANHLAHRAVQESMSKILRESDFQYAVQDAEDAKQRALAATDPSERARIAQSWAAWARKAFEIATTTPYGRLNNFTQEDYAKLQQNEKEAMLFAKKAHEEGMAFLKNRKNLPEGSDPGWPPKVVGFDFDDDDYADIDEDYAKREEAAAREARKDPGHADFLKMLASYHPDQKREDERRREDARYEQMMKRNAEVDAAQKKRLSLSQAAKPQEPAEFPPTDLDDFDF